MKLRAAVQANSILRASVAAVLLAASASVALADVAPKRLRATVAPAVALSARDVTVAIATKDLLRPTVGQIETTIDWKRSFSDVLTVSEMVGLHHSIPIGAGASDAVTTLDVMGIVYRIGPADTQAVADLAQPTMSGKVLSDSATTTDALIFDYLMLVGPITFLTSDGAVDGGALNGVPLAGSRESLSVAGDLVAAVDQATPTAGFSVFPADTLGTPTDALTSATFTVYADTLATPSDAALRAFTQGANDSQGTTDGGPTFNYSLQIGPRTPVGTALNDAALDTLALGSSFNDEHYVLTLDQLSSFNPDILLSEGLSPMLDSITSFVISKPTSESTGVTDAVANLVAPATVAESATVSDSVVKLVSPAESDAQAAADSAPSMVFAKGVSDTEAGADATAMTFNQATISESQSVTDSSANAYGAFPADTSGVSDTPGPFAVGKAADDSISQLIEGFFPDLLDYRELDGSALDAQQLN